MATFDLSQITPIPGFDSLQWLHEVQTEIHRETEGMTDAEIREYYRKSSEQLRKEREQYWAEQAKAESADS
jgi:hypothetical protein